MPGYDIKASLSAASTTSTAANVGAGTTFNFASPGAMGDFYDQNASPVAPASAVSSAAGGDAVSSAPQSTSAVAGTGSGQGGGKTLQYVLIGVSVLSVLLTVYLAMKHRK